MNKSENGSSKDAVQWICRKYWEAVEYYACHTDEDGKEVCDTEIKDVLVSACDWE